MKLIFGSAGFAQFGWLMMLACTSPISGSAAGTFPNALIGKWCGVESEYTGVDIKAAEIEEGDGVCKPLDVKSQKGEGLASYRVKLDCDPGVEGKKSKIAEERYSRFDLDGKPYLIREGSLYVKEQRVLYRRCKDQS